MLFGDIARMLPIAGPSPQKRAIALFAIILLGACRSEQQLCVNDDPHWTYNPRRPEPVVDVLLVTQTGGLMWNGKAIDQKELATRLDLKAASVPTPTTLLRHKEGADCSAVAATRTRMSRSLDCASGDCAEGREWDSIPDNGINGFDGGGTAR